MEIGLLRGFVRSLHGSLFCFRLSSLGGKVTANLVVAQGAIFQPQHAVYFTRMWCSIETDGAIMFGSKEIIDYSFFMKQLSNMSSYRICRMRTLSQRDPSFCLFHIYWNLVGIKFCICTLVQFHGELLLSPFSRPRERMSPSHIIWCPGECSRSPAAS